MTPVKPMSHLDIKKSTSGFFLNSHNHHANAATYHETPSSTVDTSASPFLSD